MIEREISTMNELLTLIDEYSDKKLFFRGENKNHKETSCLPANLRKNAIKNFSLSGDMGITWFTEKLESLGIKTPLRHCKGNSSEDVILNALINISPHSWLLWGEDKLQALMKHYAFDFIELEKLLGKDELEASISSFPSNFLDITSDVIVALHFACSEFGFYRQNEEISSEIKIQEKGYLFVFDLKSIENANHIKLVHYPSYAYFYKNGEKNYFQPFDRITHQRGAFLTPKIDKNGGKNYRDFENELKTIYLVEKIILKRNVKQELYKLFGSEIGLDYYFPKILPLLSSTNNDILESYKNLKGITLLEK